ncbi:CerR family C-terminal domain-containing protein [Fundidesulfovibrio butyratiphilus]
MPTSDRLALPRGEDTRRRLLEEAIVLFAEHGYKAVSTRAIAQAAGANHAGIGFHFQNKSGLHQEAVNEMVREFSRICQTFLNAMEPVLGPPAADRNTLGRTLRQAVAQFVAASVETKRMRLLNRLFQQEQLTRSRAADQVYRQVARPVLNVLERLAVAAGAAPEASLEAQTLAVSLLALMTVYGREAAFLENHMGGRADSPELLRALTRAAVEGTCGMLGL